MPGAEAKTVSKEGGCDGPAVYYFKKGRKVEQDLNEAKLMTMIANESAKYSKGSAARKGEMTFIMKTETLITLRMTIRPNLIPKSLTRRSRRKTKQRNYTTMMPSLSRL